MFYTFHQNNSGGRFIFSEEDGITHIVIIEADSSSQANEKATDIGLYFDGEGDCPCCGDRWYPASEKYKVPSVYGLELSEYLNESHTWMAAGKEAVVHFADGTRKWYGKSV